MTPRRIRLAVVVYGILGLAALGWGYLRGEPNLYHHPEPLFDLGFPVSTLAAITSGAAVALVVIVSTRVLVRRTQWARALHVEFRNILGPLSGTEIAVFAVTSGIAEEMFFRGAMQPATGLWISSVIFGLAHVGPMRRFWVWTVWATVMGVVFGLLYACTGELLAPVVAHVLINYENMHFIEAYDPNPPGPDSDHGTRTSSEPRLVNTRMRAGR